MDSLHSKKRPLCLIVDDIDSTRELLVFFLEQMGLQVVCARDGQEAVAVAKSKKPSVVLLDVLMPVMDGYTACSRIKGDPALAATKVVMISALTTQNDKNRAAQSGADAYLEKPISLEKLKETLKRVVTPV